MNELTKQHWFSVLKGFVVMIVVAGFEPLSTYLSTNIATFTYKGALGAFLGGVLTFIMSYMRNIKQTAVITETKTTTIENPNATNDK